MKSFLPIALSCAIATAGLAFLTESANAENPFAVAWALPGEKWKTYETEHFVLNFLAEHEELAQRAATISEKEWDRLTQEMNWTPQGKVQVVLTDDFDFSNGWAHVQPFNQMRLYLSPPDGNNTLEYYDDWFNLLITHELTHVIHLDMVGGVPKAVRTVLGRNQLTFPHAFTPGFMIEGYAVYKETDYELGVGRGQSSLYQMMMREEVLNGIDSLGEVSAPMRDWPLGKQYLYGYYYYQFLADTYGDKKITEYLNLYARNMIPFFLQNSDADTVFGKNHELLWQDFIVWLKKRFEPQVKEIQSSPLITGTTITREGLFIDAVAVSGSDYYYLRNNGEDRAAIVKRSEDGGEVVISEVISAQDLDVSKDGTILYTRLVPRGDGRAYADVFVMDQDGNSTQITEFQRFRNARWVNDNHQILAKRISGGISELVLLNKDGEILRSIWQGTLDDVLGEYNVSPDGNYIIANIKRAQQGWNLEIGNLQEGQWQQITNTRNIERNARFTENGETVIFSADYGQTFNLYEMNLKNGDIQQLTHVMGGAVKPIQLGSKVFYQSYSSKGYSHSLLDLNKTDQREGLNHFNIDSISGQFNYSSLFDTQVEHSKVENYSAWPSILPTSWIPIWVENEDYDGIGLTVNGGDALGRHAYSATAFYDNKNDLGAGALTYNFDNKWSVIALRSHSYGVVLMSDEINIRREDTLEIARTNLINAFENRLKLTLGVNSSNEYDLSHESLYVSARANDKNALVGARLDFDSREYYARSISPTWGTQATILWESNDYLDSDFTGDVINASVSHFFDLPGNQVIAVNAQGAYGYGNPEPFELGGEESYLAQPLFGRDIWSLRGYGENVQSGNRIQTNSIEYRYPIANVESGWDLFPLGLGAISGTVFADHGSAWSNDQNADYLTSMGVEMNVEVLLAYSFPVPIKFGYAKGLDKEEGGNRSYLSAGFSF